MVLYGRLDVITIQQYMCPQVLDQLRTRASRLFVSNPSDVSIVGISEYQAKPATEKPIIG